MVVMMIIYTSWVIFESVEDGMDTLLRQPYLLKMSTNPLWVLNLENAYKTPSSFTSDESKLSVVHLLPGCYLYTDVARNSFRFVLFL